MDINNKIYFSRVRDSAIIPTKRDEDAGYDIYACFDDDYIIINVNETVLVPTGIASALPKDKYIHIEERGSTGSIGMKKSAGIIDSGYRGEWFIAITNCSGQPIVISKLSKHEILSLVTEDEDGDGYIVDRNGDPVYVYYYGENEYEKKFIYYPSSKAIAQAIVAPVLNLITDIIPYEDLKQIESERGTGALGSSDK